MYSVAHIIDIGLKKENNEDAILIDDRVGLFVVADGMGGHERGEVASRIVVDSFKEAFSNDEDSTITYSNEDAFDDDETVPYMLNEEDDETVAYDEFNDEIYINNILNSVVEHSTKKIVNYVKERRIAGQIGTTVVGLYQIKDVERMAVFHLGDSRAYRIRDNSIVKLTVDHSKYEQMKQSGKYTSEQLAKVNRNSITKAIGNFRVMPLEINYFTLKKEDIYIVCSDGVSDLVHASELLEIITKEINNLDKATIRIKNLVYERGAKDNLSMIVFRYR
jgi:protein phosphatase